MSQRIDILMENALEKGVFPGAVLLCALEGEVVLERAYGLARSVDRPRPMTLTARFDLASVTKAIGTTVVAMIAVERSCLELDEPVHSWLPVSVALGRVTPRLLLSHCSGLPAWLPLHLEQEEASKGWTQPPDRDRVREWMRARLGALPLEYEPGRAAVYSDLGFMVLEWLLEVRMGERIDSVLTSCFLEPLGLTETGYVDLDARPRPAGEFVATERCSWRGRVLEGEVHDHNTYAMGGICGQAGLFSTAHETHLMLRDLWQSWRDGLGVLGQSTVRRFWSPSNVPGSSFRLGWDGPSPEGYSAAGRLMSRSAVGHLGFTGCSVWLDPQSGFWVVLLTNRIHPSAENRRIAAFRPELHDLLVRELLV
ncbi:MAG: serine hydrolase [bacterium]